MLIEAHGLAQLQIASELADYEENLVLQSDGTSKKSHSFTTFNVSKSNGQFHVLGLCEVGSGDAETQLHILEEVVGDVNEFTKSFSENFFLSVKNLMSDQCNTQKKFNKLFINYHSTVLPKIKSN